MRIYATRKQAEMIVVAMMKEFGSKNVDSLELINNVNNCLLHQQKKDKSHYMGKEDNNGK